jgi:UDP-glucose 4-epimerase
MHESLLTSEEFSQVVDQGTYYKVAVDSRGMRYEPYFQEGALATISGEGFTSANATQLEINEVIDLLMKNREFLKLVGN